MMKNMTKKIISLMLVMAMMAGVAFAASHGSESTIIIHGKQGEENSAEFTSDEKYTNTDLFDNFKNVMPGDKLEEKVVVKNEWRSYDYITLNLSLLLHDEEGNPLTYSGAYEAEDGKDQDKVEGERDETVATMHDFLSQLTMRIYDDNHNGKLVFESSPVKQGELIDKYYLGSLGYGQQFSFTVELEVPAELGNEYANRVGEVDWVFTYSGWDYEEPTTAKPTTAPTTAPTEPTTTEGEIDIEDPEIPLVPVGPDGPGSPDTGDHSNMLPYIVLFIVGLMGLILTSKKRKTN